MTHEKSVKEWNWWGSMCGDEDRDYYKAQTETLRALLNDQASIIEELRQRAEKAEAERDSYRKAAANATGHCVAAEAEREGLLVSMHEIAYSNDIDPRAEARTWFPREKQP